ncbi:uncharacterized protein NECHADRAFT_88707 [Fusarium vanettenii 77-13-4]|uniref:Uncharacterized protein n=1 Tax=Fusarium vanettenii (strain ATCC MYA-4622 / CBS 123669 / FGSC 9596 / NRRL 45880 / 77-13-4) TaxID=660122 RepID=C7ZNC6_FUSV7|nr:uncharacterized protein NECHADRAFT_88707 [Fusarium vanettenii 77-13-4]EEU34477.1 predicted protein [Fusarium vanettenii 77-13-4]
MAMQHQIDRNKAATCNDLIAKLGYQAGRRLQKHRRFTRNQNHALDLPNPFSPFFTVTAQDVLAKLNRRVVLVAADHCNINRGRADERGDNNRNVLKGFKALISNIQSKAVDFGALTNPPAGWIRASGHHFASDDEAVNPLRAGLPQPVKAINKTYDTGLSSSRWRSNKSDALPDRSQLSLDDGADLSRVAKAIQRKSRRGGDGKLV